MGVLDAVRRPEAVVVLLQPLVHRPGGRLLTGDGVEVARDLDLHRLVTRGGAVSFYGARLGASLYSTRPAYSTAAASDPGAW